MPATSFRSFIANYKFVILKKCLWKVTDARDEKRFDIEGTVEAATLDDIISDIRTKLRLLPGEQFKVICTVGTKTYSHVSSHKVTDKLWREMRGCADLQITFDTSSK